MATPNSYSGIRRLKNNRAIVGWNSADRTLSNLPIPFADRDDQIGGGEIVREPESSPIHQGFLHIISGCLICEWSIRRNSRIRINFNKNSLRSKNNSGQQRLLLVLA